MQRAGESPACRCVQVGGAPQPASDLCTLADWLEMLPDFAALLLVAAAVLFV